MRRTFPVCLLLLAGLLAWFSGQAQNFPVQLQVLARPPYTTYLADLASPTSEQLYVSLLLKDMQLANRPVRLKTVIEGPGTRIVGADNVAAPPINLLPGSLIQLSGSELAVYFRPEHLQVSPAQYARTLPEGMYRFGFTAFDYQTNQQLSATVYSNYAWLQRSDPPLLVLPTGTQPVPALPAQQVLFQWMPRHSQVNATEYELTITEIIVPQGFTGNPQNLFLAQPPFYTTRTQGTTFLYGPANPPLTPGRLYGYRIQAVPRPGEEGRTSFNNNGFSQIGFFAYGYGTSVSQLATVQSLQKRYEPPTPPETLAKTMKGRVIWSFKKTELEADTARAIWVVNAPSQAYPEATRQATVSAEKSSVANPLESAQVTIMANGKLIGTAKTDKDGNYEIKGFNPDILSGVTTLTVRASSTIDFTPQTRSVAIQRGQATYDLGQSTLIAQTFRFATQVVAPGVSPADLSVRLLRRKETVDKLPYLAREGNGSRDEVTYNGQTYISIATMTSTQAARRIFYNTTGGDQLVVQLTARGKSPLYVPLSAIDASAGSEGNKPLVYLKRNYVYKSTITVAGKVGVKSPTFTAREGVRIDVTIRNTDLISPLSGPLVSPDGFRKTVTSDKNGQYTVAGLPMVKKGAKIRLDASDNTLAPLPQTETILFTGDEVIDKDITLRATASLVAGIVNDQYGKPVVGAQVKVQTTGQVVRTNEFGYFLLKAYATPVVLDVVAAGYTGLQLRQTTTRFAWNDRNTDENPRLWERTLTGYTSTRKLLELSDQVTLTPELAGGGDASLSDLYDRLIMPAEQLGSMGDAGVITLRNQQGLVNFVTTLDGQPTSARIQLANGQTGETGSKGWSYLGDSEVLGFKVLPSSDLTPYLPVTGDVTVTAGERKTITIALEKAVVLKGRVASSRTSQSVGGATVEVVDLPYKTTAGTDGNYQLYVPHNREIRVKTLAKGFNTGSLSATLFDNRTYNFSLDERDSTLPEIKTILGYTIEADKLEAIDGRTVRVSGTLRLPTDGAFTSAGAKFLTFSNVIVDVDDEDDGIPQKPVVFREVELNLKAFKYAPVKLESREGLVLSRYRAEQTVGLIGGLRLRLNTEQIQDMGGFSLSMLPRTTLALVDPNNEWKGAGATEYFKPAFCNLKTFPAVAELAKYRLEFSSPTVQLTNLSKESLERIEKDSDKFFPYQVNVLTFLFSREKCILNNKGIEFVGQVRLPMVERFKWLNDGIEIERFLISDKLDLKELSFKISDKSPLEAKLGGWRARLERLLIYDNFRGVGFGGRIATTDNKNNDFLIDKLFFIKQAGGVRIGGKITLPKDGYKISSLKFNTPAGFELAYLSAKKTFEIDGSLKVDYTGTSRNSVASLFPLEVQRFVYRSNQEMMVAVKANASLSLGPVKVNIRRFYFNRGVKTSFDEIQKYMKLDSAENARLTSGSGQFKGTQTDAKDAVNLDAVASFETMGTTDDERVVPFAEGSVSWGIGIAGGVEVDVRSLQVKSDASVLVVDNGGSMQVRVNEFAFLFENSSFKAQIKAKTVYTDVRQGFEGSGDFETLSRKFACSFRYYKVGPRSSDIELGLSLLASVDIPMGSVTWTQLGGQIDFNIAEKKYLVALMGALKPTAVDKKMIEFDRVKVSILFDAIECGAKPVIKGTAGVRINQVDWGMVSVTLDLCRTQLLVTLANDVEVLKGIARLRVNGLLYAKPSMVFFGCNAQLTVPRLGQANALIALGITARRNQISEAEPFWRQISGLALEENGQYFNGINVRATMNIAQQQGGYSINLGIGSAGFSYKYWADADLELYGRFSRPEFGVYGRVRAGGSAHVDLLGSGFGGSLGASAEVRGGYNDSRGWYFNGNATLNAAVYNDEWRGCNSADMRWCSYDVCIGYPCGWGDWCHKCWGVPYPCGFSFKLCRDVQASFNWQSR